MRILIVATRNVGDITSGADLRLFAHLRPMLDRHEFSLLHSAPRTPVPRAFQVNLSEFFGDRIVTFAETKGDWRKVLRPPGPMAIASHPFAWRKAVIAAAQRFDPDVLHADMLQACLITPPAFRYNALGFGQDSFRRFSATRASTASNWFKQFLFSIDTLGYAFYERCYKQFGACAFLSAEDIESSGSPSNAVLVENGVTLQPVDSLPVGPTVFFGGNLQYLPNKEGISFFIKEVFPKLVKIVPEFRLVVAGRSPEPDLLNLASDQIEIIENPENLNAILRSSRVAICPVKWGAGQKNKILEAAAAGRPIVTDPHMIEGSAFEAQKHVLTASTPMEWTDAVLRLLTAEEEAEKLRTVARELVEQKYSWLTSSTIVEECYIRLSRRKAKHET